ncbi:MAG: SPFH domain-containing protein [bacterium]
MSVMIEILEWVDPTGDEMIYRIPQEGSADIKMGAQLIVRDSQMAMFFHNGHVADSFTTGRHSLSTHNLPIITRLLALPFGFKSPFRAEVYFVNQKVFTDLKWGTKHPVTFKDSKLGLIRLRGHGAFTMQIENPMLFLNSIVGRQARYTTADIQSYLRDVIIARLNDLLGEELESVLDLPAVYTELAEKFKNVVHREFDKYGLELVDFYIASITPPDEVAKLIDQRSGMEAVGDVDKFLKFEMARGLGAPGGPGGAGAGIGMAAGVGVMMPSLMNRVFAPEQTDLKREPVSTVACPKCHTETPEQSRFCYRCGHQMIALNTCPSCNNELPPEASFCLHCGQKLNARHMCPHCKAEIIMGSRFCGSCGKQIEADDTPSTTASNQSGFYIGLGCPGCGGEVRQQEDFYVLTCGHCGSVLRVRMPDQPPAFMVSARIDAGQARFHIDRFQKKQAAPLTNPGLQYKFLYYPYWKVDAIMLKLRNRVEERVYVTESGEGGSIEHRTETPTTNINLVPYMTTVPAGPEMSGRPPSIGSRADYIKLVPYSRENTQDGFDSLPISRTWAEVWEELNKKVRAVGTIETAGFGRNRTEMFRPLPRLVYYPLVVAEQYGHSSFDRWVLDGLSGRVVDHRHTIPEDSITSEEMPVVKFGELEIDFHRCPNCGDDLPADDACLCICTNCDQVINLDLQSRAPDSIDIVDGPVDSTAELFPFWVLDLPPSDEATLRAVVGGLFESTSLVVPAFRMSGFDGCYRLARRMSTAHPRLPLRPLDTHQERPHAVNVSFSEALLMGQLTLYRARLSQNPDQALVCRSLEPGRVRLLYVPFQRQAYFFVDTVTDSVTFEKKLIS